MGARTVATRAENEADKLLHGRSNRGSRNGQAKLTEKDVERIRGLSGFLIQKDIGEMFGVSRACVSDIVNDRRWRWVNQLTA